MRRARRGSSTSVTSVPRSSHGCSHVRPVADFSCGSKTWIVPETLELQPRSSRISEQSASTGTAIPCSRHSGAPRTMRPLRGSPLLDSSTSARAPGGIFSPHRLPRTPRLAPTLEPAETEPRASERQPEKRSHHGNLRSDFGHQQRCSRWALTTSCLVG